MESDDKPVHGMRYSIFRQTQHGCGWCQPIQLFGQFHQNLLTKFLDPNSCEKYIHFSWGRVRNLGLFLNECSHFEWRLQRFINFIPWGPGINLPRVWLIRHSCHSLWHSFVIRGIFLEQLTMVTSQWPLTKTTMIGGKMPPQSLGFQANYNPKGWW